MKNILKRLYENLETAGTYPLSNIDINNILNCPIIEFGDFDKFNNINEIIPSSRGAVVLFLRNNKNGIGHWCALIRDDNYIEFFDSYGENLLKGNKSFNKLINGFTYIYNPVQLQNRKSSINTCGFHVIWRLYCFLYKNMNLPHFLKFMNEPKDHDRAVVYYITEIINKHNL